MFCRLCRRIVRFVFSLFRTLRLACISDFKIPENWFNKKDVFWSVKYVLEFMEKGGGLHEIAVFFG